MKPAAPVREALRAVGARADETIDLAETALLLGGAALPGLSLDPYRRHLRAVSGAVAAYTGAGDDAGDVALRAEALAQVVARRFGYCGDPGEDEAGDGDDANLVSLIDHRRGGATGLGILYLHAAAACGWSAAGIDFPARMLVRLEAEDGRLMIDPFDMGRVVGPADMRALHKAAFGVQAELEPGSYDALGRRGVLLRLLDETKARLLRDERLEDALDALDTMLLISPGSIALWRESGLISARLGRVEAAVAALEEYMRHAPGDQSRYSTSALLQELRARLN